MSDEPSRETETTKGCDMWPTPIVTPQELIEAKLRELEIDGVNNQIPNGYLVLREMLEKFRVLGIGGR